MKRSWFLLLIALLIGSDLVAQKWKLGGDYGRAIFRYQNKAYGTGYLNANKSNRGFSAQFIAERQIGKNSFVQTGLRFALFQQYFSTRLNFGPFEEVYPVIMFPAFYGVNTSIGKMSFSVRGGPVLGLAPDQFQGEFLALLYVSPNQWDSIARGRVIRDQGPVFPLVSAELAVEYKLSNRLGIALRANGTKGFRTITKYEIYYNDGSGRNDQYAEQWGTGDYFSAMLGLTYRPKWKSQ
jgi:hypothetical protein